METEAASAAVQTAGFIHPVMADVMTILSFVLVVASVGIASVATYYAWRQSGGTIDAVEKDVAWLRKEAERLSNEIKSVAAKDSMTASEITQLKEKIAQLEAALAEAGERPAAPPPEEPAPEPEPEPAPEHEYGAGADTAINTAYSFLGVPYVWAGESYDGVDCSGLTMLSYNPAGIYLTHSSRVQYGEGLQVPLSDVQPGDLVFWSEDGTQSGIYHVAMYLGDDQMIEAPTFGMTVRVTSMRYYGAMPYAVRP